MASTQDQFIKSEDIGAQEISCVGESQPAGTSAESGEEEEKQSSEKSKIPEVVS